MRAGGGGVSCKNIEIGRSARVGLILVLEMHRQIYLYVVAVS